jgi:hypothetical protein
MTVTTDRPVRRHRRWPKHPTVIDFRDFAEDLGWILRSGEHSHWVWQRIGIGREATYRRLTLGIGRRDVDPELTRELVLIKRELIRRNLAETDQVFLLDRFERTWWTEDREAGR